MVDQSQEVSLAVKVCASTALFGVLAAYSVGVDYLAHYAKIANLPINIQADLIGAAGITGLVEVVHKLDTSARNSGRRIFQYGIFGK